MNQQFLISLGHREKKSAETENQEGLKKKGRYLQ